MADAEANERQEALTQALWYAIGQMVDEKVTPENLNATPQFIAALTQVVWSQMESVTQDLEAFCGHAGRSTISTDDVLLLCRRNNDMHQIIKDFIDQEKADKATSGKGKGKRARR
ncbi:related to apoptosis-inducing TAF9-like domain 1 family protein, putative [Cephalotrichum gorgonifer]|uniref:Related to apoptosis-inducing TAF9-like domain 1 family protein, putative n=1 Tax=Cephalotrichum gorgonifer TaxID=2041049 RepID=A0AAE8MQH8_9PEZI|nr:related to apoptosis-inducing TAF9-like domain 1 family protein, putative [Cephalotrichum gorgonifer]